MYEDSACPPRRLSLKFLNNCPSILAIEGSGECDEPCTRFQLKAECGYGGHDIAGVACAADEDDCSVAPVKLHR